MKRAELRFPVVAVGACALLGAGLVGVVGGGGCASSFGKLPPSQRILVNLTTTDVPTEAQPRAITFDKPDTYTVDVSSLHADGTLDTTFNGYVRISTKPGTVLSIAGDNTNGRNVQLVNGTAQGITVNVLAAYGDTRIWAEDLGYVPADPARQPPPQCSDGLDNDGDGTIDYPADPGCAFANDDTEVGGTYAAGTSQAIPYQLPRVADVRGVTTTGGTATAFPHEQVTVDTGYRGSNSWTFGAHQCVDSTCGGVVVTRISSDGFYVTDLGDNDTAGGGRGYASVFAYNFSSPPNMKACDRLRSFGGTTSDFFGFTEVNYPTWELEEWNPAARPCLVPEPHTLAPACTGGDCFSIGNSSDLLKVEAALVRVASQDGVSVHIASLFGPGAPASPAFLPTADATNCDLNHDGKVDRTVGGDELICANACDNEPSHECSEYSGYLAQSAFRLVVTPLNADGTPQTASSLNILANASTSATFDPVLLKGRPIRAFTGTLRYFSGGAQFTIEARCDDDIVVDLKGLPIPSDTACVHARTSFDTSAGSN